MKNIFSNNNKPSFSDFEKCAIKEDTEENNENNSSSSKMIIFFIFTAVIIILILIIILIIIYKFLIKPDLQKSRRNKDPMQLLSYKGKIKIGQYFRDCINGILYDSKKYNKSENPKISVVIPVYNKEKFILRVLRSIQNQSFKDIEIIFYDDGSYDNSTKLIEEFQKEDERIILIKHDINKGTLITRNEGAIISKGEYLLFHDGDDLLVNDILEKAFLKAKENDIDIIQYQTYYGDFYKSFFCSNINRTEKIKYQPEISSLMYYEKGYPFQTEFNLWGKLIKRETFMETIKSIEEYYLNQNMSLHEDGLMLFTLFKKAKSYLFINEYGLFHFTNEFSKMSTLRNKNNINKATKDTFLYLEFMYNYTNDTLYEKNMAVCQFKFLINTFNDIFLNTTQGFDYVYNVIDLYINCKSILDEDKTFIKNIKEQFQKTEKNLAH